MEYQMPEIAIIQFHSIPSAAMAPACVNVPAVFLGCCHYQCFLQCSTICGCVVAACVTALSNHTYT